MNPFKSEHSVCAPNLNSLMKISLGLIFFTVLTTALVYAEIKPLDENNLNVHIIENAFLYDSAQYFDNTMISTHPGKSVIITNDDTVSHSFVSGISNANAVGKINYDEYLLCEFDPNDDSTYSNQTDRNDCDFNKDNRIITGEISPGESVSIPIDDVGTYRIIDPDYPWMEILVYSFPNSSTDSDELKTTSVTPSTQSIQNISVNVYDTFFNIPYTVTGMSITGIESDTESVSLIFSVDVTDSTGKLGVQFERSFFDSVYGGVDDSFFILADGDKTIFRETQNTLLSRTLIIDVPAGTEELEVIGSVFDSLNVVETPVVETPVVETPVVETPVVETPSNECGPGTILENNACVLDQRCGPGTILENNACVVESPTTSTSIGSMSTSSNKELIISFSLAFGIAGVVGIILAIIAKAHKKKN